MAKFEKGNTLGGRTKGAKNKTTQQAREYFTELLNDNLETLREDFKAIAEPEKRIKLFLELAQYCIPKLKSTELNIEATRPVTEWDIKNLYTPTIQFTSREDEN